MGIDCTEVSLPDFLIALWKNATVASFFRMNRIPPPPEPSIDSAKEALSRGYVDYFNGRSIKTKFSNPASVDPYMYNRDAGNGAFERVLASMPKSTSGCDFIC